MPGVRDKSVIYLSGQYDVPWRSSKNQRFLFNVARVHDILMRLRLKTECTIQGDLSLGHHSSHFTLYLDTI